MNDFISFADLDSAAILDLLDMAGELKRLVKEGSEHRLLEGQTLAMLFEKPSLRTRVTFETGMYQLGGHGVVIMTTGNSRLGEREAVPDVARNLERWVDGIMARTYSHEAVVELAENASVPVINGLTDKLHPCQVLADALTLLEKRGYLDDLTLAFVGDGNNVCASWCQFAARIPIRLRIVCPEGYEADESVLRWARDEAGADIVQTQDPIEGVRGADCVYTDVWASMGQEDEAEQRKQIFQPYQVNAELMAHARPDALFMHCLPAHRGEEVTSEVIESPRSVVFEQAENRLHAQKAVLVTLMQKDSEGLSPKQRSLRYGG